MKTNDIGNLIKSIKNGSNQERHAAVDALRRKTVTAEWWPELRDLIRSKKFGFSVPRQLILVVGRMKSPPPEVMDEVIAAAKPGYQGEVPQYFSEAAVSAVRISPEDPRLPDVLAHGLTIDNYQIQKSAVEALMAINSDASREILRTIRERLPREYWEKLMLKLLDRVDEFLNQNDSA